MTVQANPPAQDSYIEANQAHLNAPSSEHAWAWLVVKIEAFGPAWPSMLPDDRHKRLMAALEQEGLTALKPAILGMLVRLRAAELLRITSRWRAIEQVYAALSTSAAEHGFYPISLEEILTPDGHILDVVMEGSAVVVRLRVFESGQTAEPAHTIKIPAGILEKMLDKSALFG